VTIWNVFECREPGITPPLPRDWFNTGILQMSPKLASWGATISRYVATTTGEAQVAIRTILSSARMEEARSWAISRRIVEPAAVFAKFKGRSKRYYPHVKCNE